MSILKKCSRCHSTLLEDFFSKNRKGVLQKCCDTCLKRFKCDKCDAKFTAKTSIERHIKAIHDKIKDFECPTCDDKFSYKGNLQNEVFL